MNTADFFFKLPPELIARYPLDHRSKSRLLHLDAAQQKYEHRTFLDFVELLQPGDLLVFNDTKVIPARLMGRKETGGKVEVLIERVLNEQHALSHIKSSKAPKVGSQLYLEEKVIVEVVARQGALFELKFGAEQTVLNWLKAYGHMPLPPYMERADEADDWERYQTVYGCKEGAVAAPTAGLHFDTDILNKLRDKGVEFAYVTLHVGAGTFQPVRVEKIEDHVMHQEFVHVPHETVVAIERAKERQSRVVAVGTTAVRSLESAAQYSQEKKGILSAFQGETDIFIYPGYQFKVVDALLTNFHLPESTLIMLVAAFAGQEFTLAAYKEAVEQAYRFFSYGDAMFISSAYSQQSSEK